MLSGLLGGCFIASYKMIKKQIGNQAYSFYFLKIVRSIGPKLPSVVKTAKAKVFYFHEFLDAVVGTFTAEPRLFDTAKRCNLV